MYLPRGILGLLVIRSNNASPGHLVQFEFVITIVWND